MENKKNNKKILIIGFIFLLAIAGGLFYVFKDKILSNNNQEVEKKKEATATPLLYEVTKNDEDTKLYLFGSIHAADDRAYPMQDKIMEAYNSSEYLAVELDLIALQKDLNMQFELVMSFLCENGKKLKDYLSPDGYETIIKYMKDNDIYNESYEMYRPGLIYSLISNVTVEKSKLDVSKGIDMYFLSEAKNDKKQILEIESAQMQYNLLASMPDELYEFIILSYISQENQEVEELVDLYESWLKGNVDDFIDNNDDLDIDKIKEGLTEEEKIEFDKTLELLNTFNDAMINNRNTDMTDVVDNYFKEGKNVFVVVGVAHIVGENGLANELANLGYNVNLIDYK